MSVNLHEALDGFDALSELLREYLDASQIDYVPNRYLLPDGFVGLSDCQWGPSNARQEQIQVELQAQWQGWREALFGKRSRPDRSTVLDMVETHWVYRDSWRTHLAKTREESRQNLDNDLADARKHLAAWIGASQEDLSQYEEIVENAWIEYRNWKEILVVMPNNEALGQVLKKKEDTFYRTVQALGDASRLATEKQPA